MEIVPPLEQGAAEAQFKIWLQTRRLEERDLDPNDVRIDVIRSADGKILKRYRFRKASLGEGIAERFSSRTRFESVAKATIRWLTAEEGGRPSPPRGPIFGATGSFATEPDDDFSIILRYVEGAPLPGGTHDADLDFLARDLVLPRLHIGSGLLVKEGRKVIARCTVTEV